MAREIQSLTLGKIFYINEVINGVATPTPYIWGGLDENGNGRILRKYAVTQRRMHSSNVAEYNNCEADIWLENTFLNRFSQEIKNNFVPTTIKYTHYNEENVSEVVEISRTYFILSGSEVGFYSNPNEGKSYLQALMNAAGTTNANTARITYFAEGSSAVITWLRSAYSGTQFHIVGTPGTSYYFAASTSSWLRPAISISSNALVSDDDEYTFLLETPDKEYTELDAIFKLGTMENIPEKIKCILAQNNCSEINAEITFNGSDSEVYWQAININELITITKPTIETNIDIQLHLQAKSLVRGTISQPYLVCII